MKKSLLALAVTLIIFQSAFPQIKRIPVTYQPFVSIGYGNTASDNLSEYYDIMVNEYIDSGVPINKHTEFGPTLLANTGIIFSLLKNIGGGVSFGYLYSPAYSNYKDFAGTAKINGAIKSYDIFLKVQYTPVKVGYFSFVISPQIGASYTSLIMTQEIRFIEYQQLNYDWKMSKSGWGLGGQVTIGTSVDLGEFTIALEGGYRHTRVQVAEQTEESTAGIKKVNEVMDIGVDGFIFQISFGTRL